MQVDSFEEYFGNVSTHYIANSPPEEDKRKIGFRLAGCLGEKGDHRPYGSDEGPIKSEDQGVREEIQEFARHNLSNLMIINLNSDIKYDHDFLFFLA